MSVTSRTVRYDARHRRRCPACCRGVAALRGAGGRRPRPPRRARPAARAADLRRPPGEIAPWVPRAQRGPESWTWTTLAGWQVVPGVSFEKFDLTTPAGPIRGHLLRIDTHAPGISLDYARASADRRRTAPLLDTVLADQAIAGVNGDFFDISDTGAPLGVGRDRQRRLLHGVAAAGTARSSSPATAGRDIDSSTRPRGSCSTPRSTITNVNSPSVARAASASTPTSGAS